MKFVYAVVLLLCSAVSLAQETAKPAEEEKFGFIPVLLFVSGISLLVINSNDSPGSDAKERKTRNLVGTALLVGGAYKVFTWKSDTEDKEVSLHMLDDTPAVAFNYSF